MTEGPPDDQRSLIERALGLVTDVRAGEGGTALLMSLNLFLLLGAYYVIKPIREALILAMASGAQYKSYMSGVIAIGLLFAVPAYSAFAKRVPRNRLVVSVTLFFASNLVLFYLASLSDTIRPWLGLLFFFWVGIFNMMVVAQLWAFANDIYDEAAGERIFPLIGVGASVGSLAGSIYGIATRGANVYVMMLAAAGMLVVVAVLSQVVHRREVEREARADTPPPPPPKDSGGGAFGLVFKTPYLLLIAIFTALFTLVNTNGEFMVGTLVSDWASQVEAAGELPAGMDKRSFIKAFFDEFYFWVNGAGVFLQLFVVSRVVKYGGLRIAFFILPVVALLDATLVSIVPILAILRIGKIAENSLDYSLNNTVRNMLWLPTTREMKYRAKQAIDSFFVRMGDVGSALFVFLMADLAGFGVRAFAITNAVMIVGWIAVAWMILKQRTAMLEAQGIQEEADAH
ncbi:MAG: translocase [Myxococcales bacterium]|nr:translocase [Myxococcales bacterium]